MARVVAQEGEAPLDRILAARLEQLVDEGLDGEGGVGVADRAPPEHRHGELRLVRDHAQVRDGVGHVRGPLDHLRVVDAAADPGQLHRGQVGDPAADPLALRGDPTQVLGGRGRRARQPLGGPTLADPPGAATPLGDVGGAVLRLPDPAAHGLAADHLPDHHRVVGVAVHEVLGAVDRVDREGVLGHRIPPQQVGVDGVGLLPQQHRVRVGRAQHPADLDLGLAVGHGDQVTGVLLDDLPLGQRPEPGRDDRLGDLLDQPQHGLGLHGSPR